MVKKFTKRGERGFDDGDDVYSCNSCNKRVDVTANEKRYVRDGKLDLRCGCGNSEAIEV